MLTIIVFLPVSLVEGQGQFFMLRLSIPITVSLVASLFSHAAHPVIIHDTSNEISAEYSGFAVERLKKTEKSAVHLFAQGCSGNINAHPLKGGIDAAKAVGGELAEAVKRALKSKMKVIEKMEKQGMVNYWILRVN